MVGSLGAALDPWSGPIATIGQPTGAQAGAAVGGAFDRDLAWQTTVGQIVFLQSVIQERT
jgi:hypothetical protein